MAPQSAGANSAVHVSQTTMDPEHNRYVVNIPLNPDSVKEYLDAYIHTYVHTYLCTYVHTYVHTYIITYVHMYICTYVHMYVHKYTHT